MGLELDSLKENSGVTVIYDNTTGNVEEFYDIEGLIKFVKTYKTKTIKEYFSLEEIEEFFIDFDLELNKDLLDKYF